jgi:hypothetical protein
MSNELTAVQNNPEKLNQLFGYESRPKPVIPFLKINGSDEEEGVNAPKGTFTYDDGERILYANEVVIRSFVKAYQYRLFDPANKESTDSSIIGLSFKDEFRSASGRIACGRMSKKAFEAIGENATTQQKYFQEKAKCKLLVFGVVSGEFTDLDTKKKVEVKDQLFSWVVSQSGFVDIDGTIKGIGKERRPIPLTPIRLSLKKEKNGSVTYFIPVPHVINETVALVADRDAEYLAKVKNFITETNQSINAKYNEAIKLRAENENFAEVTTIDGTAKVIDDTPNDPLDL